MKFIAMLASSLMLEERIGYLDGVVLAKSGYWLWVGIDMVPE